MCCASEREREDSATSGTSREKLKGMRGQRKRLSQLIFLGLQHCEQSFISLTPKLHSSDRTFIYAQTRSTKPRAPFSHCAGGLGSSPFPTLTLALECPITGSSFNLSFWSKMTQGKASLPEQCWEEASRGSQADFSLPFWALLTSQHMKKHLC